MTTITPPTAVMDPRIRARRQAVAAEEHRVRAQGWLFVFGLLIALALGYAALQSPLFDIDKVTFVGAETNREVVVGAAAIDYGTPLINADVARARAAIAELPWVESVTSKRHWNGELTFTVTERAPAAQLVSPTGAALVVDADGRVLAAHVGAVPGAVIVHGLEVDARPGQWLDDAGLDLVRAAAAVPDDVATATSALHADGQGLALDLRTGASVLIGDDRDLTQKFDALRAFLVGVDLRCLSTLDLRAPSVPVLVRDTACQQGGADALSGDAAFGQTEGGASGQ